MVKRLYLRMEDLQLIIKKMKIKTKQINELEGLMNLRDTKTFQLSEAIKTQQARTNDKEYKLEREGKKIKLKESILWQEIKLAGLDCQAGKILEKEYPEIFALQREVHMLDKEIDMFTLENWGFQFRYISLSILIKLIKALVIWRIKRLFFL
jgi:hypothetical protein